MISCYVISYLSKLSKNKISVILKFVVRKQGPDIEISEEDIPLISGGKNAISACNNYNYLMQSYKTEKQDSFLH